MANQENPSNSEFTVYAEEFGNQFFARRDLQARQLDDGRYICIHQPLQPEHLVKHLAGKITLGTYLLDENSAARFIVLDADDDQRFDQLKRTTQMLAVEKTPGYLETSRRGGHLWLFFPEPIPSNLARRFGRGVMAVHGIEGIELYPKQDQLGKGPGSLIRAPFGVHQLTGLRYPFLNLVGQVLPESTVDQLRMMVHPRTVSPEAVEAYAAMEKKRGHNPAAKLPKTRKEVLSERIKSRITALEFIGRYVDLKPTASGAIGRCPFHDDQNPSLGVNTKKNYWYCFAGCRGGSIIDFWMKWRLKQGLDASFVATIKDLANMFFKS